MANWPTWVKAKDCVPYSETISEAGDLRSGTEGGYVVTRRRYSRAQRSYEFSTIGLSSADLATARTFISTYRTTGSFSWTGPDSTVRTMRFASIPTLTKTNNIWSMSVKLVEV